MLREEKKRHSTSIKSVKTKAVWPFARFLQSWVSSPVASPRLAPHQTWIYCSTGSHPPCPHPTMSPVYSQLDPQIRPSSFTGKRYRTKSRASPHSLTWNLGTIDPTAHSLSFAYCPQNSWNSPRTAVWNLFYSPYTNTFSFPPLDKRSRLYSRKYFRLVHLYLRDHCWELGMLCT